MKSEIKINGLTTVSGMKFHEIEGGFGEGKKAMLAKEISGIHGKSLDEINRAIGRNRKRFHDGQDIIDLKRTEFVTHLVSNEIYSQNAANRSSCIYLLSERGYAKLLKILEDDLAWEKYDQLVDGYFQMRRVIRETPEAIDDAKRIRAEAMLLNAKTRAFKTVKQSINDKQLSPVAFQLYGLSTIENILGEKVGQAPGVGKLFTATEIANSIGNGCNAQKVGKMAKAHNLQTDEYGIWALDKSPYSAKQVRSFRYIEKGKAELLRLFGKAVA